MALAVAPSCVSVDGIPITPFPFVTLGPPMLNIKTKEVCPFGKYCKRTYVEEHYHKDTEVKFLSW